MIFPFYLQKRFSRHRHEIHLAGWFHTTEALLNSSFIVVSLSALGFLLSSNSQMAARFAILAFVVGIFIAGLGSAAMVRLRAKKPRKPKLEKFYLIGWSVGAISLAFGTITVFLMNIPVF